MEAFRAFTPAHFATLACVALLVAITVWTGKQLTNRKPFELTLAWTNLVIWAGVHGWWMMPPRFDAANSLPLHMCHIASLIASAVLIYGNPALRAVLYFWTFSLCTQAMITPAVTDPPSSPIFWAFWGLHAFLMQVAVYDIVVRGFRPQWRDYLIACTASMAYVAFTLPVNLLLNANYGFTGPSKPHNPSIIDVLGPWPERLLLIVPLAALAMFIVLAPWLIWRRLRPLS